jgi:hypothetical protein
MAQIFAPKIWGAVAGPVAEWVRKLAGCYISARSNGTSFTIAHASDADTDKTFTYEVRNP